MFFKRKKEDFIENSNDVKINSVNIQLPEREKISASPIDNIGSEAESNTIKDVEMHNLPVTNSKIIQWGDSVVYELKCMTWPSFQKVIDKMWITIVISFISGIVLYGLDIGLELLSSIIYK